MTLSKRQSQVWVSHRGLYQVAGSCIRRRQLPICLSLICGAALMYQEGVKYAVEHSPAGVAVATAKRQEFSKYLFFAMIWVFSIRWSYGHAKAVIQCFELPFYQ